MTAQPSNAGRWWIYQRERFPILAHGPLIAVFSISAVCFSALLRGQAALPGGLVTTAAVVSALLFFLQLRIADEFKDFEEDCRFRPYRPVPRGLVQLWELAVLGALSAAVQLALALWVDPALVYFLIGTWAYLALMSKEFFLGPSKTMNGRRGLSPPEQARRLVQSPLLIIVTHMVIIPLIDLYVTACDWLPQGAGPPPGLGWFLAVSYFNGVVLELGRKIRAPQDEEPGVDTYTRLWGVRVAVGAWCAALGVTAACAVMAAHQIDFALPAAGLLVVLGSVAGWAAFQCLKQPTSRRAKTIEVFSGLWTLAMYLQLGIIPLLIRLG